MISENHREPQTRFRAGENQTLRSEVDSKVSQLVMIELRLERRSQEVYVPKSELLRHWQWCSPAGK